MHLRISRLHYPVTVLGPGRRVGIWVQGCSIGCAGCLSQDTWSPDAAAPVSVARVIETCRRLSKDELDGVTISGGEPFDQPVGLRCLLEGLHAWRAERGVPFDVLCYSGRPLRYLRKHYADILALLDAIVPEPYVHTLPQRHPWRGSSNQPLVPLSELGRSRYLPEETGEQGRAARVQLAVENGRLWMIGLPRPSDLDQVAAALERQGVLLEQTSWRL
jgi:anaerobic ribonucleoside-triphosphate reductase activating protein